MPLTTQHWIGIGGAAALLGYLLWPKKAHAATPITPPKPTPPPPSPYVPPPTPPISKDVYTSPPAVPYGTPTPGYVVPKDFTEGEGYGKSVGAKYGATDRDSGADPVPLDVKEEPTGSDDYVSGFRVGFPLGYSAEYYKPGAKKTAPAGYTPAATKDTGTAQADGYSAGYAAGKSDPSTFPAPTFVAPSGYRDKPSDPDLSAFWVAGFTNGYSDGFKAGHDPDTGALISGSHTGQGLARYTYLPSHWSAFMPRTTPAHYGMWTPPARQIGMAGVGYTSHGVPVGVAARPMVDFSGRPMKHPYR